MSTCYRAVLWLGMAVVATGCGTFVPFVTETPLNPPPRRLMQRSAEYVEVYSSTPPTRPHVDMALLEVEQNGVGRSSAMLQALRERAGAMGCDAVFIGAVGERGGGSRLNANSGTLSATCVVYLNVVTMQPDVAAVPPSPPTPPEGRRMCRDRQDFEATRDCILPRGG